MKKFCNKITKQQWRLTVPNVNTSMFKKSPKVDRDVKCGSYDLEEAQREYDRSRSVPNSVLIETDSSDSENYQDACAMSEKRSSAHTDDDLDVYEDADNRVVLVSKNLTETNGQFEYDVPKISFSFFEGKEQEEYATVIPMAESTPTHKSEVNIVLASPESFDDDDVDSDTNSERDVSDSEVVVETKTVDLTLTKDLADLPVIMKSGSDPNISYRRRTMEEPEDDDGLYKVPRRHHRLSQSLNDFNVENIETITSTHTSVEHISCSQVIPQEPPEEDKIAKSSQNSESMDYCKTRSKLPLKLRRVTLLRKPKAKAVDTWINIRSKFNNMMTEHASSPGNDNKEKLTMNIQEVYNNSRDKCKRVLKSTGRIFKRNQENIDPNSDTSSQIIKNHAFFANLKASDIEYKLNYSNNSDELNKSEPNSPDSNKFKVLSLSASDEKKEEFDFSTIKSAFRRSKLIASTEVS